MKINPSKLFVVLNEELYQIAESHYNRIFRIGKPTPKIIKILNDDERNKDHEKTCEAIRKYGKKILDINRILRDD